MHLTVIPFQHRWLVWSQSRKENSTETDPQTHGYAFASA